jgi:hypothetical protein
MDRTAKVNLLFEQYEPDEILEALTLSDPEKVNCFQSERQPVEPPPRPESSSPDRESPKDSASRSDVPHVVCLFSYASERDRDAYEELRMHLAPRLRRGSMTLWSSAELLPGESFEAIRNQHLAAATVILIFVSAELLADEAMETVIPRVLRLRAEGRCLVIPVLISPADWEHSPIGNLQPLPRDRVPLSSRKDRDAAWVDVIQGLSQAVQYRAQRDERVEPAEIHPSSPAMPSPAEPLLDIGVIFTTTYTPQYTYVEPEEYVDLRNYLKGGARLVVQGHSGSGKSSIVRRALHELKRSANWLSCSEDAQLVALKMILNQQMPLRQSLVIDEAHLLDSSVLTPLSKYLYNLPQDLSMAAAESQGITVIGLGQLRQALLAAIEPGLRVPLEKRLKRITLSSKRTPQNQRGLEKFISLGEQVANVQFTQARELIEAASGSFYILQELCLQAATIDGIETSQKVRKRINVGIGEILPRMMGTLKQDYAGSLSSLARTDEVTPPRGAVAVLLWMLSRSPDEEVAVEAARAQYPALSKVFDWLLAGRLAQAIKTCNLTWLLEFEEGTNLLKALDPRFLFYLRFLDWAAFLANTGHTDLRLGADGLLHLGAAEPLVPPELPPKAASPMTTSVADREQPSVSIEDGPPIPPSLAEALSRRQVVPFAGAGVSRAVKRKSDSRPLFPDWKELLLGAAELLKRSGKQNFSKAVSGLVEIGDSESFLDAAKRALQGLGPAVFYGYLRDVLDKSSSEADPQSLALAQAMWTLGSKLVITTNYDQVLRWACPPELRDDQRTWDISAPAEFASMLSNGLKQPTVWHLHGYVGNLAEVILTPDGYSRLYPENKKIETEYEASLLTLRAILASRTLLFVGFSFTDEIFSQQVRWIQSIFANASGPHYLMTEQSKLELTRERLRGMSSIELIPFASREALPAFLRSLAP